MLKSSKKNLKAPIFQLNYPNFVPQNVTLIMRTTLIILLLNILSAGFCYSAFAAHGFSAQSILLKAGERTSIMGNNKEKTQSHTVYSEDSKAPSECDIAEAEVFLNAFLPMAEGYKITTHSVKSIEKKVLNDIAYNYGYYEISGTQNGKKWGPQKMAYLILWKKTSAEQWKMYLDIWDYKENDQKELYLF